MLEIIKTIEPALDPNMTKFIIKASKDIISTTKLEPKQINQFEQQVQPEMPQEQEPLFKIY